MTKSGKHGDCCIRHRHRSASPVTRECSGTTGWPRANFDQDLERGRGPGDVAEPASGTGAVPRPEGGVPRWSIQSTPSRNASAMASLKGWSSIALGEEAEYGDDELQSR